MMAVCMEEQGGKTEFSAVLRLQQLSLHSLETTKMAVLKLHKLRQSCSLETAATAVLRLRRDTQNKMAI